METIVGMPYRNASLSPSMCEIDKDYQRSIDEKLVAKIVREWDDRVVRPLKVSRRADGKYYVIDGQHTLAAWKIVHGNTPIPVQIYEGLTRVEEKDLFVKQSGTIHLLADSAKLRAEYQFGNTEVVDMVECAKLLGYYVDFDKRGKSPNTISAVSALYKAYKMLGRDNYINILTVMRNAWGSDKNATDGGIIKGIAFLYKYYSDKITNAKMVDALVKQTPDYYLREAKELSGSQEKRMAKVMIKIYNSGKRTNRLPEF